MPTTRDQTAQGVLIRFYGLRAETYRLSGDMNQKYKANKKPRNRYFGASLPLSTVWSIANVCYTSQTDKKSGSKFLPSREGTLKD